MPPPPPPPRGSVAGRAPALPRCSLFSLGAGVHVRSSESAVGSKSGLAASQRWAGTPPVHYQESPVPGTSLQSLETVVERGLYRGRGRAYTRSRELCFWRRFWKPRQNRKRSCPGLWAMPCLKADLYTMKGLFIREGAWGSTPAGLVGR